MPFVVGSALMHHMVPHQLRRAAHARALHGLARELNTSVRPRIPLLYRRKQQQLLLLRHFSEWKGGTDILENVAAEAEQRPKIVMDAYAPTGFDVSNMIQKVEEDPDDENDDEDNESGSVHMAGSILVFPRACFLWAVTTREEITLESLAPVMVYRPKIKYLFLGCNSPIPPQELAKIKKELKSKAGIVVEQLTVVSVACFLYLMLDRLSVSLWSFQS